MKRTMNLTVVYIMAIIMSMNLLCTPLVSANSTSDFVITDGVLTKYTGSGGDVIIPDGVTSIGSYAFHGNTTITGVTFPNSVTSIGKCAFSNCKGLTEVTIPDSVLSIENGAFETCTALVSLKLPSNITSINKNAFYQCKSLTEVIIPDSVTSIGISAFGWSSKLKSVTMPVNLISIGDHAFAYCEELESIVIPEGVTSLEAYTFSECYGLRTVTLPRSLTTVSPYAFDNVLDIETLYGYTDSYAHEMKIAKRFVPLDGYLVTYDTNGTEYDAIEDTTVYQSGDIVKLPATVTNGASTLTGWKESETSVAYGCGAEYTMPDRHVVFTPISDTKDGIVISYYSAGIGYGEKKTVFVPSGTEARAISPWTQKAGGVFTGWADDELDPTVVYMPEDVIYASTNINLFATWSIIPIPIGGTISVGSAAGGYGDEVDIPVSISNNQGIATFTIKLNYDNTKLLPVSITKGAALTSGTITTNILAGAPVSPFKYVSAVWTSPSNFTANGVLFTVRFKVITELKSQVPLTITHGAIANQDFQDFTITTVNGVINLTRLLNGDINADGEVNGIDAIMLVQSIAGGYNVTFTDEQRGAADVYADGIIDGKDALKMAQYLASWPNVVLGQK